MKTVVSRVFKNILFSQRVFRRLAGRSVCSVFLILFCTGQTVASDASVLNADVSKSPSNKSFVGSEVCASCHTSEYELWSSSHHAQAMMLPSDESVVGDFTGVSFKDKGVVSTFSKSGNDFFITIEDGDKKSFKVAYTFGVDPLQQYLIEMDGGRYQVYDVAWDARSKELGGQRWYKLLPDEDTGPDSPFHWSRHTQNWNSRCSDCHSTGVDKGYSLETNTFDTTFSELNVACEACHGKGSGHVDLVEKDLLADVAYAGFDTRLTPTTQFKFVENSDIAIPDGEQSSAQVNACGGCHSRRQLIGDVDPADDFHDQFMLRRLESPLYFADGQIQDEVFVLGSFLQSKMSEAGVQCTNCHEPHSGKLKIEGNGVCAQCHKPSVFDVAAHHNHKAGTEAAQCVTCHMPETTYMGVDDRRDHSFRIPYPNSSEISGSPSVCKDCHQAQSNSWAQEHVDKWSEQKRFDPYTTLSFRAQKADPLVLRPMVEFLNSKELPAIKRASLIGFTGQVPSRLTAETIQENIRSNDPMVRAAAIDASDFIPIQHRYGIFRGLLTDPSATVRFALARQLAGHEMSLSANERAVLISLLAEYESQLRLSQDLPSGQLALADYYTRRGMVEPAFAALDQALLIEPDFAAALLNKADLYRATGDELNAEKTLKQALKVAPDSGAVQHAYGLNLVRLGRKFDALEHLRLATQQEDANTRFYYVYAIALDGEGMTDKAVDVLNAANQLWPNQYDVLFAIVTFLEKLGRENERLTYLSNLSAIAPNDPTVKALIEKASR